MDLRTFLAGRRLKETATGDRSMADWVADAVKHRLKPVGRSSGRRVTLQDGSKKWRFLISGHDVEIQRLGGHSENDRGTKPNPREWAWQATVWFDSLEELFEWLFSEKVKKIPKDRLWKNGRAW